MDKSCTGDKVSTVSVHSRGVLGTRNSADEADGAKIKDTAGTCPDRILTNTNRQNFYHYDPSLS